METKIKQYYKQKQYNVLQTAIENTGDRFKIKIKGNEHLDRFIVQTNLTSDIMKELKNLGYQITKIPTK